MLNIHPSPYGHVVLPEPDFGRPGHGPDLGERVVKPTRKKGGSGGAK